MHLHLGKLMNKKGRIFFDGSDEFVRRYILQILSTVYPPLKA